MIRIRTTIGDKRVYTLFHAGKWVTLITGQQAKDADSILQAGINHLEASKNLLQKSRRDA
jgi:hypothetical protein